MVTNYLATANLVSVARSPVCLFCGRYGFENQLEAIRISSGNSFVHETESQVILNGSCDINFTMDLESKRYRISFNDVG